MLKVKNIFSAVSVSLTASILLVGCQSTDSGLGNQNALIGGAIGGIGGGVLGEKLGMSKVEGALFGAAAGAAIGAGSEPSKTVEKPSADDEHYGSPLVGTYAVSNSVNRGWGSSRRNDVLDRSILRISSNGAFSATNFSGGVDDEISGKWSLTVDGYILFEYNSGAQASKYELAGNLLNISNSKTIKRSQGQYGAISRSFLYREASYEKVSADPTLNPNVALQQFMAAEQQAIAAAERQRQLAEQQRQQEAAKKKAESKKALEGIF